MGSLDAPFQFDDIDQMLGTSQGMGGSLLSVQEFMKENRMNRIRLQLQLHKIIWSPDTKGV
jgi:hypothetical protein